jgi:hypothetical protein
MKKIYTILLFAALSFSAIDIIAQPCVPDSAIGGAYMHPEKLAFAQAGYYYTQVLTFRVPKDTTIIYQTIEVPATIDSAKLLYMGGVPPGYFYECGNGTCTWKGGTLGCALLAGISDSNDTAVGEYPIKIFIGTWFKAAATDFYRIDSSENYTFKVLPFVGGFEITKYNPLKVYPNPTKGKINIEMRITESNSNVLRVVDMQGKLVFEKSFNKPSAFLTSEEVDLSSFPKGIYLVQLSTEKGIQQSKILLQ